jgi:SsrA-binding protein
LAKKPDLDRTVVAQNRKARFDYFIEETFEAGLQLTGTEVKSLRGGRSTIAESYVTETGGEAWLVNANIPLYASGNRYNHEPKRPRKLLLHRAQINKLIGAIQREGRTVVPLQVYFNEQRPGQDRDRPGQGQAGARQAPDDQGSRLATPTLAPPVPSLA